ncbi:restriction endonuclease [Campylobacter sp. MIT 97-5078]|uniref:restriction endonuclease n=1 Tax=Campylobacter sp. MIT 97-5078 TaxID=1548153 RepID=UPI000513FBE1|nr:DEAD/DEAH box helicase family protein [Campylobacter sp. MIT 97-5078]KGI57345.1 DEAD/DEAH box helicase [Campylobacter sp. MIT 97-5078]TQR28282.1 DEAD/DEAH box helicase [Campylobacter sp. MIT 97-5078]
MIFERQVYQQECIGNVISVLQGFDFDTHNAENLKACLDRFYSTHTMPLKNLSNKLNLDILMETGTGKTFTYLNLIFELHRNFNQNKFIIFVPRKAILESVKQNIKLTKDYFYTQYNKHLKAYVYSDTKSQSNIINHYIKNTNELSVLILTNSSIDKKDNILNRSNEGLFNVESIFTNIANLKPISIIDEPHLLKGEAFNKYFSQIDSLYFRFGATFPKEKEYALSNIVYCLDSINAFNHYLVKQIRTHTIIQDNTSPYLIKADNKANATFSYFVNGIEKQKRITLNQDLGELDPKFRGSCLIKITKDKVYLDNGEIIQTKKSYVLQESEISLLLQKAIDLHFKKEIALFQKGIKALSLFFIPSIEDFRGEEPFIKKEFERIYKQKREEVLRQNLPQEYREYLDQDFDKDNVLRVHQGYFSGDSLKLTKKKESNKENIEANDIKMILEEKEKILSFQTPLRFIFSVWALQEGWDNPNIFTLTKLANSSSETSRHQQVGRGLRLCVNSEGKRITHSFVDYNDNEFFAINYLDMIVSSKERGFLEGLQKEIEDSSFSLGSSILNRESLQHFNLNERQINKFLDKLEDLACLEFDEDRNVYAIISPIYDAMQTESIKELLGGHYKEVLEAFKPKENKHEYATNGDNETTDEINIRQNLAKEFKELWQSINAKAQIIYQNINQANLIESIVKSFNAETIPKENILYEKKVYDSKNNRIIPEKLESIATKDYLPTLHKNLPQLLIEFAKNQKRSNEELPLKFLLEIYNHPQLNKQSFINSPKTAFEALQDCIKEELHKNLIQSVSYDFSQNIFSNERFQILYLADGTPKQSIKKHILGRYIAKSNGRDCIPSDKYLYDKAVCDSKIEEEISLENNLSILNHQIEIFAKLPKLSIPTPYKNYEPDFAYLLKNDKGQKIFFVCESKGYDKASEIPEQERKKIDYARVFFEKLNESMQDKNIKVLFNTRINKQNLLEVLQEVIQQEMIQQKAT